MYNIKYTKFINLNNDGSDKVIDYGYRIYDSSRNVFEYMNDFNSFYELKRILNKSTLEDYLVKYHYDCYQDIYEDKNFYFNDEVLNIEDL